MTVRPGPGDPKLEDVPEPDPSLGPVLVQGLLVGVCHTDHELIAGRYGDPPPGHDRLVMGHESLGRVVDPGGAPGLAAGDLVAGIVRRPDPVPCPACAAGDWDYCTNGRFTEHGLKELDGFLSERWRVEPDHAVRVPPELGDLGVLVEPASIIAKAWEQVDRVGARGQWSPERALVTGAGPVGLLAALLCVQRGLETHVLDRVTEGRKPELATALGAEYHAGTVGDLPFAPDVVIECTGAPAVLAGVLGGIARGGVVSLVGFGPSGEVPFDLAGVFRRLAQANNVVVGSVNAARRHHDQAVRALEDADPDWLARLITRRVPMERFADALDHRADDVKVVVEVG